VEAVGNLGMVGVEMGSQLQIIGDDCLDADAGEAQINPEATMLPLLSSPRAWFFP